MLIDAHSRESQPKWDLCGLRNGLKQVASIGFPFLSASRARWSSDSLHHAEQQIKGACRDEGTVDKPEWSLIRRALAGLESANAKNRLLPVGRFGVWALPARAT
jgi:hypothetical protein